MDTDDKRMWLATHGEYYVNTVFDSGYRVNWYSKHARANVYGEGRTPDEATNALFRNVKNRLYDICLDEELHAHLR